jgi:hypothetical protein
MGNHLRVNPTNF